MISIKDALIGAQYKTKEGAIHTIVGICSSHVDMPFGDSKAPGVWVTNPEWRIERAARPIEWVLKQEMIGQNKQSIVVENIWSWQFSENIDYEILPESLRPMVTAMNAIAKHTNQNPEGIDTCNLRLDLVQYLVEVLKDTQWENSLGDNR